MPMKAHLIRVKLILLLFCLALAGSWPYFKAGAQSSPVVQAVLFYRSTCPHCVQLVGEVLPPIVDKYGDKLQIFYCDVSFPAGDGLFTSAIDSFSIKPIGVPTIVVGEKVLVGSKNIEEQFPGIIDAGLAGGGLSWPAIPGLEAAFSTAGSMQMPVVGYNGGPSYLVPVPVGTAAPAPTQMSLQVPAAPTPAVQPAPQSFMISNFRQDPRGNSLAVLILLGMVAALVYGISAFFRPAGALNPPAADSADGSMARQWRGYMVLGLCLIGAGISAYLAYVEIFLAEAICGPVGNCNAVQSSPYARLFGVLPIGVLGLAGYATILIAWAVARFGRGSRAEAAGLVMFGLTAAGLLFSIYLTFLEPFIIGASCLWCLTSAVIMTVLFLLNARPAGRARFFPGRGMASKT